MTQDAFCGCSDTARPLVIFNRPGLSEIAYRVGTFASFREAMLLSISQEAALAHLTTRGSDDYAITILELFAAAADVLSFCNERIANELYLRTARERDSLLRLTRLLGYRLRPGLAAETLLSFALEEGAQSRIRKGFKVMSVPGQDEKAQIFETIEALAAHGDLNEAAAFAPPVPFNGFALGSAGGPILTRPEKLGLGAKLIFFGLDRTEEKSLTALRKRADGEVIGCEPAVAQSRWTGYVARLAKLEGRLRFFGHAAPENVNVYVPAPTPITWPKWVVQVVDASLAPDTVLYPLDARHTDIATGAQLLIDAGPDAVPRLRTATIVRTEDRPARLGMIDQLTDTVTHVELRQTLRGRPGLAASLSGLHAVYARSGSGSVMALDPPAVLRRWNDLGLMDASSDVHALALGTARQDIFVRDSALRLRQRLLLSGMWGGWVDHGGILTSEPRPVFRRGGGVFVFARGTDLGLWFINVTSAGPGSWISLGGILTSAPAPISHKPGGLAVFVRGTDRALWHRTWDGAVWSQWDSLKGLLASGPGVASTAMGRIDVAALDDSGGVIHRKWDGTAWSEWRALGGNFTGDVALVAASPDRIDIFARDRDGALWTNARTGETWGDWQSLGGRLISSPSAARDALGLHVYAQGGDGSIATRSLIGGTWTAWASHGNGIGAIPDRRKTAIYRLGSEDIVFRAYDYPAKIRQGRLALRMRPGARTVGNIAKGRRVLLRSYSGLDPVTVIATTPFAAVAGELDDHLFVDFTPGPTAPLSDVTLLGNVATASHGETQPVEALGHGEGAKSFQAFRLSRPNLTYLQSATALEGSAALEIRVNGELWKEAASFFSRKSTERIYTARQNDGGETQVMFGDGVTGARLPSGAMNVSATYRTGLGLSGRMKAEQLSIPLERPVGFRSVANPLPADGAADPETRDEARSGAPRSVRTFGRAVSLADFEAIATASGLAARASVTWTWSETERAVHVTVAGPRGAVLSTASLARLRAALDTVRDPNRPLFLANFVRVPIVVTARLLRNPAYEADAMIEDARARLLAFFAFDAMPLGEAVFASRIYAELQGAKGVLAVDVDVFQLKHYAELTPVEQAARAVDLLPRQPHIRIFPARPAPPLALIDRFARAGFTGAPPPVLAAEQAFIEDPATDLILTAVEAL